jgi:ribonuclease T
LSVCYISVDVETAGPTPDTYSLLSIGAVAVGSPTDTFYVELQPDRDAFEAEAMAIHALSHERLASEGVAPSDAMRHFEAWVLSVSSGQKPVFVAYNAPFDWMFVNVYFHRYLGRNPFGHSALDMKAVYMGAIGSPWAEISHRALAVRYGLRPSLTHNALADAEDQALLFSAVLEEAGRNLGPLGER